MASNSKSNQPDTTCGTIFSYLGFGIAMIVMIVYIPTAKSAFLNAVIGAGCGITGAVIGGVVGSVLDRLFAGGAGSDETSEAV